MQTQLKNIVKTISKEGNASSLLISHEDKQKQLYLVEKICQVILKLSKDKSYRTHQDIFGIWPEHIIGRSIKIEQIHEFIRKTQLKPYSARYKIGIIVQAEKMTLEAQNTLLKTLEEPPLNTFIILTCRKTSLLLQTIISRCQVIEHQKNDTRTFRRDMVKNILSSSLIERFDIVEKVAHTKDKEKQSEQIEALLFHLSTYFRKQLRKVLENHKELHKNIEMINLIELTKRAINRNVNVRLSLENLMIHLPHV